MKKPKKSEILKWSLFEINFLSALLFFFAALFLNRVYAKSPPKILSTMNSLSSSVIYRSTVSGTVADADGVPLPGVNILVQGTTVGTQTDFDGNYTPEATTGDVLTFSYLGMKARAVTVGSDTNINMTMQEDAAALDEVVVTALGIKREERALGYAVSEIKGDEILRAGNKEYPYLPISETEITNYLTNPEIQLNGTDDLEKIYIQQFLNFYRLPDEGWILSMHTGYPKYGSTLLARTAVDSPEILFPRRIPPPEPGDLNVEKWLAANADQGFTSTRDESPDALNTQRLWWDLNNPVIGSGGN